MADTLEDLQADIINLQEVHQNDKNGHQLSYLAKRLNMNHAFGPALAISNGAFGNGCLTKHSILESSVTVLPAKREPRSLLQLSLQVGEKSIHVWNTHFSLQTIYRNKQIGTVFEECPRITRPFILTGDFNSISVTPPQILKDCAKETKQEYVSTLLPFNRRLDYIFVSAHWNVIDYKVIKVRWSDHYPIVATLELSQT